MSAKKKKSRKRQGTSSSKATDETTTAKSRSNSKSASKKKSATKTKKKAAPAKKKPAAPASKTTKKKKAQSSPAKKKKTATKATTKKKAASAGKKKSAGRGSGSTASKKKKAASGTNKQKKAAATTKKKKAKAPTTKRASTATKKKPATKKAQGKKAPARQTTTTSKSKSTPASAATPSVAALEKQLGAKLAKLESQVADLKRKKPHATDSARKEPTVDVTRTVQTLLEAELPERIDAALAKQVEPRVAEIVQGALAESLRHVRDEIVDAARQTAQQQASELTESVEQAERGAREARTHAAEAVKIAQSAQSGVGDWDSRLAAARADMREEVQLARGDVKRVEEAHKSSAAELAGHAGEVEALRKRIAGLEQRLETLEAAPAPMAAPLDDADEEHLSPDELAYGQKVASGDAHRNGSHVPTQAPPPARPQTSTSLPTSSQSGAYGAVASMRDPQLLSSSAKQLMRMIERHLHDLDELKEDELWQQVHYFYPHPEGGHDRARFHLDLDELRRAGLVPQPSEE